MAAKINSIMEDMLKDISDVYNENDSHHLDNDIIQCDFGDVTETNNKQSTEAEKSKEDKDMVKLQEELKNALEDNVSTKDEVVKLNVIQGLEETNRKGYEQYDALLKEYEKVKKEKTKQEKEYESKEIAKC